MTKHNNTDLFLLKNDTVSFNQVRFENAVYY